jgi:hypothetical protein
MGWDCQVRNFQLQDCDDDGLRTACGALSQQLRMNPRLAPHAAAPSFLNALRPDDWDTLYGLLRLAGPTLAWSDVPGAQRNIVTGGPVSRGICRVSPPASGTSIKGMARPKASSAMVVGLK